MSVQIVVLYNFYVVFIRVDFVCTDVNNVTSLRLHLCQCHQPAFAPMSISSICGPHHSGGCSHCYMTRSIGRYKKWGSCSSCGCFRWWRRSYGRCQFGSWSSSCRCCCCSRFSRWRCCGWRYSCWRCCGCCYSYWRCCGCCCLCCCNSCRFHSCWQFCRCCRCRCCGLTSTPGQETCCVPHQPLWSEENQNL